MVVAPRTHGRPLDAEAALERAAQIAALADPIRLQVMSAVAAGDGPKLTVDSLARNLGLESQLVDATLSTLRRAGLLEFDERGTAVLSADAWVRFGRILIGSQPAHAPVSRSAITTKLPSTVERVVDELQYRFSTVFSPETIRQYVGDCYELLAGRAIVTTFLPTLTARFATDRLAALASARGLLLTETPEVLFVCVQNAGRSQMASAVLRHVAGDHVHVRTAGTSPASRIDPVIVESLDEIGVTMPVEFPKPLTDEVVQASDYVITMGCGDACPIYPGRRYMDWALADPIGKPMVFVRRIRDEVVARVELLVKEMALSGVVSLGSTIR